ncbi:hypothetical protein R0131_12875 [Clostridium sp. AL.422]|uniref:hypothetical protein n=1 Tax=Clostridium TaxID=1485 RepID=UPI00293DE35D|nr:MULTISPECIES: hypothetical protein [unclassified Clostridium]MDV4151715.1 hypothetical protein [Clostridium sp. AL.422]
MRFKKASIVFGVVIIVLLLLIVFSVSNILNRGTEEVKVAKEFIEELYDSGIIEENNIIKDAVVQEEALNKLANKNSRIKYSVIVGNYGVDIDKNYKVLGFSNKNLGEKKYKSEEEVSEEEAIYLAKSYISEITEEDFTFKYINLKEDDKSLVYNVVFNKLKDGYPCYDQEINTLINKVTGKLEAYTNYTLDDIKYINQINIDEMEATETLEKNIKNLKLNINIEGSPILGYINISDKEMGLAYIFNIKITSNDNKEEIFKSFVRADTGEIINSNLEAVSRE